MKKIMAMLLAVTIFLLISSDFTVHAKGSLNLEASIGFEGKVKDGYPTVLNITITNTGEAFSGDFVADIPLIYFAGSATVMPIELAAGETKSYSIYLEGVSSELAYNNQGIFSFYEGGIEKGKKVKHKGDASLSIQNLESNAKTMLVLTTREDDISNIEDLRRPLNTELITYYTSSKNDAYLADDYRGLRGIDLIIVDDFAIQDLSEKQQKALLQWVQNGGEIIFAPTSTAKNGLGVFEQYRPLNVSEELLKIDSTALKNFSSANDGDAPISIYKSTFTEQGKPLFQLDSYSFSGATKVGSGHVIQLAFPLYDVNLKALSGYGQIIQNAFGVTSSASVSTDLVAASEWAYINELFDTFSISIWLLIIGIIIYMIIIGPILYKVLKKKDMREKLWWIIPTIAIATSLTIFVIGAKDRIFNPQVHQMNLYNINDDDSVSSIFNNSLLTNKFGDYTFTMDDMTSAVAANSYDNYLDTTNLHLKSYAKETATGKKLVLRDLKYWSVNSVAGESLISNVGNIASDLTLENEQLKGTITSTLPVDLKDVKILTGTGEIDLPNLPSGKTIDIDMGVKLKAISEPFISYNSFSQYNYASSDLFEGKIDILKRAAITRNNGSLKPLLVGWTDVSIHNVELNRRAKQTTVSYFAKPIDVTNVIKGELVITNNDIQISPEVSNTDDWIEITDETQNYLILDNKGTLNYEIKMNIDTSKYNWKELTIEFDDQNYELEIVNQVTGENIVLKKSNSSISTKVEQYLKDNLLIQMNLTRIGADYGQELPTPKITLKGEAAK